MRNLVLAVDDDRFMTTAFERMAKKRSGINLVTCSTVHEAREVMAARVSEILVLVTDGNIKGSQIDDPDYVHGEEGRIMVKYGLELDIPNIVVFSDGYMYRDLESVDPRIKVINKPNIGAVWGIIATALDQA